MDIYRHPHFQPFVDPASKDENTKFPLDGYDIDTISDEALISVFDTAPIIHRFGGTKIARVSHTLCVKGGATVPSYEAANMQFAAANTLIPIPRVHRTINVKDVGCFILMDYVKGQCVADCWSELDGKARTNITSQVAEMIRQLQDITLEKPGPIGGGATRFQGRWFSDYGAGPFNTLQDLQNWCNHKLDLCNQYQQSIPGTPRFEFHNLVLTHQDITPRNLILDGGGRVWLMDWDRAGAYPPGFEQAALLEDNQFPDFGTEMYGKIASGLVDTTHMQLRSIMYGLTTAALV